MDEGSETFQTPKYTENIYPIYIDLQAHLSLKIILRVNSIFVKGLIRNCLCSIRQWRCNIKPFNPGQVFLEFG